MTVTRIDLDTVGVVPGIDDAQFQSLAIGAKENCPISRLLSPGALIALNAKLG
jgi:osmotically inducible protein OsmC